jgi:CRP/FNR family transcriptional regulator, anaerobic regulatory protein
MPVATPKAVSCSACPLRELKLFAPVSPEELKLIESLRGVQISKPAGHTLIGEGQANPPLLTLLGGWAFRFKTLSSGHRQILNFLLPGDLIGMQQRVAENAVHGVEALTEVWLCPFQRDALWQLHRETPALGYGLTWLAAQEEALVDDHLLSVGRRSAESRLAALLIWLFKRAAAVMPEPAGGGAVKKVPFPLTQQHIADALGLSLVHTHRTLRQLARRGLYRIVDGELSLGDPAALSDLAELWGDGRPPERPLL